MANKFYGDNVLLLVLTARQRSEFAATTLVLASWRAMCHLRRPSVFRCMIITTNTYVGGYVLLNSMIYDVSKALAIIKHLQKELP